jgi:hypothetical protein
MLRLELGLVQALSLQQQELVAESSLVLFFLIENTGLDQAM